MTANAAPARKRESVRYSELSNEQIKQDVTERIFVYGSLRTGERNHELMMNHIVAGFSQVGYIHGLKKPTVYGFPCLLEGSSLVEGEVYNVDAEALKWLDFFEGAPTFYERRKVNLVSQDGRPGFDVWVYFGTGVRQGIIEEDRV